MSDVPRGGYCVHTHDHGGSEAPDGLPDSILSSEPKPLRKHRPPPPPSILSHGECYLRNCLCRIYLSIPNAVPNISNPLSPLFNIYCADKPIIYPLTSGRSGSRTLPDLISGAYSSGIYRDGGSGGSGGDDGGSNGDGTGGGDECAGGAVHLARRSPTEGGDSEIGGDGDGVVMARSLSTSASGGRDMEV
ncbi:hypothetical protein Tco_0003824 [Tanacetum coccineum]